MHLALQSINQYQNSSIFCTLINWPKGKCGKVHSKLDKAVHNSNQSSFLLHWLITFRYSLLPFLRPTSCYLANRKALQSVLYIYGYIMRLFLLDCNWREPSNHCFLQALFHLLYKFWFFFFANIEICCGFELLYPVIIYFCSILYY